jgi:hypothetical protein
MPLRRRDFMTLTAAGTSCSSRRIQYSCYLTSPNSSLPAFVRFPKWQRKLRMRTQRARHPLIQIPNGGDVPVGIEAGAYLPHPLQYPVRAKLRADVECFAYSSTGFLNLSSQYVALGEIGEGNCPPSAWCWAKFLQSLLQRRDREGGSLTFVAQNPMYRVNRLGLSGTVQAQGS